MNLLKFAMRLILGKRLPTITGEQKVAGLSGPVSIRRDANGIPHLEADTLADVVFGLGYCHGQDRTFQLETLLRLSRGTLSGLVGQVTLPVDRLCRRIGFLRSAQTQFNILPAETQLLLSSYVNGINAAHRHGLPKLPHEFALLGSTPTPWQPADVLAYLKLQSFLLPSNWDVELARLKILHQDGPDVLRDFEPGTPSWQASTLQGEASQKMTFLERLEDELALFQQYAKPGGGSNNWIISGSRTNSGKPILANDPHLPASVPAPWYLASIRTPELVVAGATMVGSPSFPTGHNGFAAWGITAGLTDNTDLFQETFSEDGQSVREADGSFTKCAVIREVIPVKGGGDVIEDVRITPRGPIITPFLAPQEMALSMSAVWLLPLPIRGFLDSFKQKDFDSFRRCFQEWPALPLNVVYADATVTTGWQLVGQLPQREGFHGMIPPRADTPGIRWKSELVPFEQMPYLENPPLGYLATANQQPSSEPVPFLGHDFCDGYRATAIMEALSAKEEGWTLEDCQQLQLDVRCITWEEIKPHVEHFNPDDEPGKTGMQLLKDWDGQLTRDSAAATLYELTVSELMQRLAQANAPNSWKVILGETGSGPFSHSMFGERRHSFLVRQFRDTYSMMPRPLAEEFLDCMRLVVKKLRREMGPGPSWWSWGDCRLLRVNHGVLGQHKLLGKIFNLPPVPFQGDAHTVCQSGMRILTPEASPSMIANLRAVFDLSDLSMSRFSLAGGQSGNPFSEHFADLFSKWLEGRGVPIAFTEEAELKATVATLRLVP